MSGSSSPARHVADLVVAQVYITARETVDPEHPLLLLVMESMVSQLAALVSSDSTPAQPRVQLLFGVHTSS